MTRIELANRAPHLGVMMAMVGKQERQRVVSAQRPGKRVMVHEDIGRHSG
ncbi:MAG: hypothetical protein Rubg2KO_26430 [Rubricoccaceae bacterium]